MSCTDHDIVFLQEKRDSIVQSQTHMLLIGLTLFWTVFTGVPAGEDKFTVFCCALHCTWPCDLNILWGSSYILTDVPGWMPILKLRQSFSFTEKCLPSWLRLRCLCQQVLHPYRKPTTKKNQNHKNWHLGKPLVIYDIGWRIRAATLPSQKVHLVLITSVSFIFVGGESLRIHTDWILIALLHYLLFYFYWPTAKNWITGWDGKIIKSKSAETCNNHTDTHIILINP